MSDTVEMYITDKNDKVHFRTVCGLGYHTGELNNLKRHIAQAKKNRAAYHFLDADSAIIKVDGLTYADIDMTDRELLSVLGA